MPLRLLSLSEIARVLRMRWQLALAILPGSHRSGRAHPVEESIAEGRSQQPTGGGQAWNETTHSFIAEKKEEDVELESCFFSGWLTGATRRAAMQAPLFIAWMFGSSHLCGRWQYMFSYVAAGDESCGALDTWRALPLLRHCRHLGAHRGGSMLAAAEIRRLGSGDLKGCLRPVLSCESIVSIVVTVLLHDLHVVIGQLPSASHYRGGVVHPSE